MLWTHIFLGHAVLGLLTHSELNVTSGDAGGHARASEHVFVGYTNPQRSFRINPTLHHYALLFDQNQYQKFWDYSGMPFQLMASGAS